LQDDINKESITIDLDNMLHPYEDKLLTETQPEPPTVNTREPFNDVVKHGDIIAGFQRNRTLSDYPRRLRPWVRFSAIATLLLFAGSIIWAVLH